MAAIIPWWTNDLVLFIALQLVTVPVGNALIRYRVNYQQSNGQTRGVLKDQLTGITTFFRFLRRIQQVEGTPGLFKGFAARLVQTLLLAFTFEITLGFHPAAPLSRILSYYGDLTYQQCFIYFSWVVVVSVPMKIFITRSTLTRFQLSSQADLSQAFKILLSPSERANPLSLCMIPGLFTAVALHTLLSFASLTTIHWLVRYWITYRQARWLRFVSRMMYFILFVLSRGLLTPFEVVACRLAASAQADNMAAMDMADLESKENESIPTFSSENVIQFRENVTSDTYADFSDCVTKIRREEGLSGLWRGWGGSLVDAICF